MRVLDLPDALHLRIHRSELTYEAELAPFVSAVIDAPGKVAAALVSELQPNLTLADIEANDGRLEDRGLNCDIEQLDVSVVLRADRFEILFTSHEPENWNGLVESIWRALSSCSEGVAAISHSLQFEVDCEFVAGTYADALSTFCKPPEALPKGTESAAIFYLPPDASVGLRDSNIVLNRSSEVEGGILVAVTIVFDGGRSVQDVTASGIQRFDQVLQFLGIKMSNS